jgi:hemoglobin
VAKCPTLLEALGGEAGCRRLSEAFYARVGTDPTLRPLFPGKSLKCAIEEFAAFLIQFLGGDEEQTQRRWWLSLRESHARFQIGPAERRAWLKNMAATLDGASLDGATRAALRQFFECSSGYVIGKDTPPPEHRELAECWSDQCALDETVAAIATGNDFEATRRAPQFVWRPAVFVGLLARMLQSRRAGLVAFVVNALEQDPSLRTRQYGGRALLHYASSTGCLEVVTLLLRLGADPDMRDSGGHTPLYRAANECGWKMGPLVVTALVAAGADVNARNGVTRATALHMAARRGYVAIAQTLLECGAAIDARDRKGDTPLERAVNCRRPAVVQLLSESGEE